MTLVSELMIKFLMVSSYPAREMEEVAKVRWAKNNQSQIEHTKISSVMRLDTRTTEWTLAGSDLSGLSEGLLEHDDRGQRLVGIETEGVGYQTDGIDHSKKSQEAEVDVVG
jgi:hypothetical protein